MRTRTLYGITQSPWTQRARWVLDHHGVAYRYHEHVPMLGELLLRRAAKRKMASVPLLVDGKTAIMGSFEIAQHAESIGRGAPLFPRDPEAEKAISHFNDVAERMTNVGRVSVFHHLPKNREAQREALPAFMPGFVKAAAAPTASLAVSFLAKKYSVPTDLDAEVKHVLRPALEEVRAALGGKPYLTGGFTYADVAVACALQAVRPHDRAPLGPGARETWTNEALATEFDDLLMWRDAIYRKHR
jgi:glutathione S-transferase